MRLSETTWGPYSRKQKSQTEQITVVVSEESGKKGNLGSAYHKNFRVNSLNVDSKEAEADGQTQPKKEVWVKDERMKAS